MIRVYTVCAGLSILIFLKFTVSLHYLTVSMYLDLKVRKMSVVSNTRKENAQINMRASAALFWSLLLINTFDSSVFNHSVRGQRRQWPACLETATMRFCTAGPEWKWTTPRLWGIWGQWRPRSDCASAQSDLGLCCPLTESVYTVEYAQHTPFAGWSES